MKVKAYIVLFILALTCLIGISGCKAKKTGTKADSQGNTESENQFDDYFIDACIHANTGNFDVALKLFNKCKELKPVEASVYYEMSRLYEKTVNNNLSLQYAMTAWQYAPQNIYYALWYAGSLKQNGRIDQAVEVLEKIYKENKKDEFIVKELDYVYERKENTLKRIELWNTFQSATGYKLSTSLKLIDLYRTQKDYQSAHMVYEQIKKASPRKYQYFIDDANLYLEQHDEINANINFERAIEINPNNWEINYALYKSYHRKKDIIKAGTYLRQAFADVNTSFESKINTCIELNNEAKTDTGTHYFTNIVAVELVKLYPENSNALLTAAGFFEQNEYLVLALENYQKACGLNPNLFDAWIGAINCSEKLGLSGNLVSVSEKALEYYPNVAILYAKAAKGNNQMKEYNKALNHCLSGKSFAIDNEAKYALFIEEGFAFFQLKKYPEAEKSYENALAINNSEKELFDQIGNVKFYLNKTEEAIIHWKKAKEMGLKSNILDKKINERKFYE